MTSASNYAVNGPDRGREIAETAPISQQDKRLPNRTPPGSRRRRRGGRDKTSAASSLPPDTEPDAPDPTPAKPSSNGKDHVVDTLA